MRGDGLCAVHPDADPINNTQIKETAP